MEARRGSCYPQKETSASSKVEEPLKQYHELLKKILAHGEHRSDRTGTGVLSLFGEQLKFDLTEGFPLVTTKKVHFRSVVHELLWMLAGDTNVKYLNDNGVTIWNEWADQNGNLGPVYGKQWREFGFSMKDLELSGVDEQSVDQIKAVIASVRSDPMGRRHIVSAWNPAALSSMALPPCHTLFQFYVHTDGRLDCQLYQRSADIFLGIPFNIASYALLIHLMAHVLNLKPGTFVHTFGDVHLYSNHIVQATEQLKREPKILPTLRLNQDIKDLFAFKEKDIVLEGYNPHPAIKADVAI